MKKDALLSKEAQELLKMYDALNENIDEFTQKIRITQKRIIEGKEKLDKDGKPQTNEFGEILKWDDKFAISFISLTSGGAHTATIPQPLFVELVEGAEYIASGKIEYKTYKDDYNSTPIVLFDKFVSQRDYLIESLSDFKKSKTGAEA